jgi:LacI family repressor for deo operon, udp, cdd, tsx, nupC, and nupG
MLKRASGRLEGEAAAPPRRRKATMKDVADLAGVSLATVSRALSASAEVSPRLSQRVQTAARRLDYAVNINARGLRGKTSGLVVVLLPDIANPFFSVLLQGIEEQARSHDMSVLIGDTGVDRAIAESYWRLMQGQRADGIILLNGFLPFRPVRRASDYPIVVVSERIAEVDAPFVGIDNVAAAFDAVSYLARLGHSRVAHICGPADNVLTVERRAGYLKAVEAHGLASWREAIQPGEFSIRAGRAATARLLAASPRPTAVFAANDEIAIGAIMEAKAHGLRVPGDLSVVGFDDIEMGQIYDPPLTTIYQPRREMGRKALETLARLVEAPGKPSGDILLDYKLVVRDSAVPPAAP